MIQYENNPIAENIEYFVELFFVIDNILQKSNDNLSLNQINEIKQFLSAQLKANIKEETIFYLSLALSECIYIESSTILRYLLKEVYNINYSIPDHCIFQSALNDFNYPSLYEDTIMNDINDSNLTNLLSKEEKTLKPNGKFFEDFKTTYPFSSNKAKKVVEGFLEKNYKIRKFEYIMLWFPEYFELFNNLIEDMFNNEKLFMPRAEKYYLGIMGASVIECDILQKEFIKQFIIHGGDPKWISQGLSATPNKIKSLGKINNILAYQPWKLKELNLQNNLDYFTQSCIILTLFHKLAFMIKSSQIKLVKPNMSLKDLAESKLSQLHSQAENLNVEKIYSELNHSEKSKEKRQRNKQLIDIKNIRDSDIQPMSVIAEKTTFSKYTSSEYCTKYQDFDTHSMQYLFNMEFSWENNGTYIIDDYWSGFSNSFDNEFDYINQFTSHCFGSHKCIADTTYFRFAIITYIEKIFGLLDETFDYSKTNKLIKKQMKVIIKNIACFPENVDLSVISRSDFNDQDLLHIILLSLIAKQRAQLTYIAKVLNDLKRLNH